jgi:hypothetical protein
MIHKGGQKRKRWKKNQVLVYIAQPLFEIVRSIAKSASQICPIVSLQVVIWLRTIGVNARLANSQESESTYAH